MRASQRRKVPSSKAGGGSSSGTKRDRESLREVGEDDLTLRYADAALKSAEVAGSNTVKRRVTAPEPQEAPPVPPPPVRIEDAPGMEGKAAATHSKEAETQVFDGFDDLGLEPMDFAAPDKTRLAPAPPPPPTSLREAGAGSSSSSSEISSEEHEGNEEGGSGDGDFDNGEESSKKNKGRGKNVPLKEKEVVIHAVAKFNFFGAPHKGILAMKNHCRQYLKSKGFIWSAARIESLVKEVVADYRSSLRNSSVPTGNPGDWMATMSESLSKISNAMAAKDAKKIKKAKKKEKSVIAASQNEQRRQAVSKTLNSKYGGADQAAAALDIKPRTKKNSEEAQAEEATRGDEAGIDSKPSDTSSSQKQRRSRSTTAIVEAEMEAEKEGRELKKHKLDLEEKRLALAASESARKFELDQKRLDLEERRLLLEREEAKQREQREQQRADLDRQERMAMISAMSEMSKLFAAKATEATDNKKK